MTYGFRLWMMEQLDQEVSRLGVTHQSIIKIWLAGQLVQRGDLNETRIPTY